MRNQILILFAAFSQCSELIIPITHLILISNDRVNYKMPNVWLYIKELNYQTCAFSMHEIDWLKKDKAYWNSTYKIYLSRF